MPNCRGLMSGRRDATHRTQNASVHTAVSVAARSSWRDSLRVRPPAYAVANTGVAAMVDGVVPFGAITA
jgi:hypothetical protein